MLDADLGIRVRGPTAIIRSMGGTGLEPVTSTV
jgi:hypothetical protein